MKRRESRLAGRAGLLAVVLVAGAIGGCQSKRKSIEIQGPPKPQVSFRFDEALEAGTEALRAGDPAKAESHVETARLEAKTYEQQRQVQSMEELCAGVRAMAAADTGAAKQHWAAIRDPHLNREVRNQAQAFLDIEVPMVATEATTDEEVN